MAEQIKILENLKNGKCTIEDAQELLEQLKQNKTVSFKVSPKGAISFYGIRRMPITLYLQELDQIVSISNTEEFKKFVVQNDGKLSKK